MPIPERNPVPAPGRPIALLLVEDHALNRSVLSDYLSGKGFTVTAVESGRQALERITDVQPDVVVMDIQMPELDGLETTRRIRQLGDPRIASVPVLALTALAMPGDRERCMDAGITDYASKPISLKDLANRLRALSPVISSGKA